jgi:alpha-L-fucosidase 2
MRRLLAMALAWALIASVRMAVGGTFTGVEFGRVDGVRLLLDAWVPDGPGPFPAVIWVHGGGFTTGDRRAFPAALAGAVQRAGFAWISVEYRLAPRYPFPAATDDVESSIAYLKAHAKEFRLHPDRLVLMGESAGGLLVSYVGARHRRGAGVAAVVSFYGEHDLVRRTHPAGGCFNDGKFVSNPHPGIPQFCLSRGLAAFLGISGPGPESERVIREASAINHIRKEMPPYLLIHGTVDLHVPFEQSVVMFEAIRRAAGRCDLYAVDGGGHGMTAWDRNAAQAGYRDYLVRWLVNVVS